MAVQRPDTDGANIVELVLERAMWLWEGLWLRQRGVWRRRHLLIPRRLTVEMEELRLQQRQRGVHLEVRAAVVAEGGVDLRRSERWGSGRAQLNQFTKFQLSWLHGDKPALFHFRRSGPGA